MEQTLYFYVKLITWLIVFTVVDSAYMYNTSGMLDPVKLRKYMFQQQIYGNLTIFQPVKKQVNIYFNYTIHEEYEISVNRQKIQILPKEEYNATTMFVYNGLTKTGRVSCYPGGLIIGKYQAQTQIIWTNNITTGHIFSQDSSYPLLSYYSQVPISPHLHGAVTFTISDGLPQQWWTYHGTHGKNFSSSDDLLPSNRNAFYYYNQEAGLFLYHDNSFRISRLNIYSGMLGLYRIDTFHPIQNYLEMLLGPNVHINRTKYLIVTDKSFRNDSELFYPSQTSNPNFDRWVPGFYGNVMLVNGVIWPKMTLNKTRHRFVFVNTCNSRYLNIWFENDGVKLPIRMIRVDSDYYNKTNVLLYELLATISTRYEFVLDLTNVDGEVILKNNAPAPYPFGDPINLDSQFTGQIMKIYTKNATLEAQITTKYGLGIAQFYQSIAFRKNYPVFDANANYIMTLLQVKDFSGNILTYLIDGQTMQTSMKCERNNFTLGKTYDFHAINLTPDMHPFHIHTGSLQLVKRYKIQTSRYLADYYNINGNITKQGFQNCSIPLQPAGYRNGSADELPEQHEKIFKDSINLPPGYVTVFRVKFGYRNGDQFSSRFANQCYAMHTQIVEIQDNSMNKYFCLRLELKFQALLKVLTTSISFVSIALFFF